jgi:uncharacterized membrane protein YqgA involved in biofilm formation
MSKLPVGTFINMATIVLGSLIGLLFQQIFPENIRDITFLAVGLGVLVIGLQMSLKVPDEYLPIFIISLVLGGIIGELIGVEDFLDNCELWMRANFKFGQQRFSEGLMTAVVLFCASSITIIGAIEEGIQGKRELLIVKAALDGVTSIALASTYGMSILLSIFPMLIIQGGLTLLASQVKTLFTKNTLAVLSGVGGLLIVAVSVKMLELGNFRVANLLPSLVVVVLLTWLQRKFKFKF